ncbi:hypothetical protein EPR50_G00009810 [Perca flavescens]|uniref:Uncharacterized protein n=1 Tax=Perca flavescens TaxID=8167 RepID=A0A484DQ06_PERFV|nr:hypothetical protein EPR50_G00009810 [Perca flavescens]
MNWYKAVHRDNLVIVKPLVIPTLSLTSTWNNLESDWFLRGELDLPDGVMYVLCTLAVLTLHGLFKSWTNRAVEAGGSSEVAGRSNHSGRIVEQRGGRSCRAGGPRRHGGGGRKRVQVSR